MYIENNLSFLPLAVSENIYASGKSWLQSIATGEWRMQGWPCRVGGNGISAWQGGGEQGEEHWGELELKLEKQNRVSSWRDVNSRLRILDFIMLNTVNLHYLWVLYLWICLLTETCYPQNQFLYTQYFFNHNGICIGWGAQKTWVIWCVRSQLRLNQMPCLLASALRLWFFSQDI